MKIAIEGMDGVGKSTIAKKIADSNSMKYIEKPLIELFNTKTIDGKTNLENICENIYNQQSELIKAWFFGLGNIYTFLKYNDEDLIIDRQFASNYLWNGTDKSIPIFNCMLELIGVPDLTIILFASVETRMKRLYNRNPNDFDLTDEEKKVLGYDKMIEFLEKFNIPYVVVNTENKNIDDVCNEVQNIIDLEKKKQIQKRLGK